MRDHLLKAINDSLSAVQQLQTPHGLEFLETTALLLAETFQKGGKVLIAGNGGSLCDAAHFAEELTGVFRKLRPALPAIALTEPGHLTCVGNDLGYEWVFSRGIEAYGKPGDVFIGLTTSGKSPNIIHAIETAKRLHLKTITMLGKGGGQLKGNADLELIIEGPYASDRIQEAHMAALHIMIEALERQLYPTLYSEKLGPVPA